MNRSINFNLASFFKNISRKRGAIFGGILIAALVSFEVFNFSTTSFALQDMLGGLKFAGMQWATILAIAFCGMDFAGIARIFTPEHGKAEQAEVWYLFGAWLLAAMFNAVLTWWGVSVAILNHSAMGGSLVGQPAMTRLVPIFVAAMVWLIRVLIIGTFSLAGERLFSLAAESGARPAYQPVNASQPRTVSQSYSASARNIKPEIQTPANFMRPAPKPQPTANHRTEPTYHPVNVNAIGHGNPNPPIKG